VKFYTRHNAPAFGENFPTWNYPLYGIKNVITWATECFWLSAASFYLYVFVCSYYTAFSGVHSSNPFQWSIPVVHPVVHFHVVHSSTVQFYAPWCIYQYACPKLRQLYRSSSDLLLINCQFCCPWILNLVSVAPLVKVHTLHKSMNSPKGGCPWPVSVKVLVH